MFESNRTEFHANERKPFHRLLFSSGLHAAAIGVLALSHEPVVVAPEPMAAYQRIALVAPPPQLPRVRPLIKHPRFDKPRATAGLTRERWVPAPPQESQIPRFDLPAPKLAITTGPPAAHGSIPSATAVHPPEPAVRTGVFDPDRTATPDLPAPRPAATIGGFVDPAIKKDSGDAKLVAKVGAFGSATSGGSTDRVASKRSVAEASPAGFVEAASAQTASSWPSGHPVTVGRTFGAAQASRPEGPHTADVRTTSFGAPTAPAVAPRRRPEASPAHVDRGVEIVSKPRPQYTDEARHLRVEGEVVLEVLFNADGKVHVNRVLRGLGHGLDERAVEAASQISFLPACREGKAVDVVATVRIQFQLA